MADILLTSGGPTTIYLDGGLRGAQGPQGDPASNLVISVNGQTGGVVIDKNDIGLGNVDNTSDANKPISTATQTALNTKEPTISAGTTGQYWRGDKTWQTLNAAAAGADPVGSAAVAESNAKAYTDNEIATLDYPVDSVNGQTGTVALNTDDISEGANKYVTAAEKTKLSNLSGVNTGDQDLSSYATSAYVDALIASVEGSDVDSFNGRTGTVISQSGDYSASQVSNNPTGNIASTDIQGAITELDGEKVSKAGDTMTGAITVPSVIVPTASAGFLFYNTVDQTTNYERIRQYWNSNTWTVLSESAGTGTVRNLQLGTSGGSVININNGGSTSNGYIQPLAGKNIGGTGVWGVSITPTLSASSGINPVFIINPTVSQSSTAGYTALLVNPTESTVGSGAKSLADFQVGGVSRAKVENTGRFTSTGVATAVRTVTASTTIADNDYTIRFNSTSPISQALPTTSVATGQIYVLKNINTGVVTITNTIEGTANRTLATQYVSLTVQWNGTNYDII